MSIYRKNLITNDFVIFAPGRSKRPRDHQEEETDNLEEFETRPAYRESCPFCKGNEHQDDKEEYRLEKDGEWMVRILRNKYASVERDIELTKNVSHMKVEMSGFGVHDVVIDHPAHNTTLATMTRNEIRLLLQAYLERYRQIADNKYIKYIVIFKNWGATAGGSLQHPHSQIYGLPVIPFETRVRLGEVEKYYEFNHICLMCDLIAQEKKEEERIVYENDHFISWIPYAALSPFHLWIVPKKCGPSFLETSPQELNGLADMFKVVFYKLYHKLRNPDFNYVFQSLTRYDWDQKAFHWYISVIPQVKKRGGIEYAGGLFVNSMMPEDSARELNEINPE